MVVWCWLGSSIRSQYFVYDLFWKKDDSFEIDTYSYEDYRWNQYCMPEICFPELLAGKKKNWDNHRQYN